MHNINSLIRQYQQALRNEGIQATINHIDDSPHTVLLKEYKEGLNPHDHKYIYTDHTTLSQGDVITVLGGEWLCVSIDVPYNGVYVRGIIRQVKFYLLHEQQPIPCIMDTKTQTTTGTTLPVADGAFLITVPESEYTKGIEIDSILFVANQKLKVTGHDFSKFGLVTLYTEKESWSSTDVPVWDARATDPEEPTEPEEPVEPITYTITGNSNIRTNQTITYTITPDDLVYTFTLDDNGHSGIATITSSTDTSVSVKATNNSAFIQSKFYVVAMVEGVEVARKELTVISFL